MLRAYAGGIFPMADGADTEELFWVDPKMRGVFPLDQFHVSRSLAKRIRRGGYAVAINRDFMGTIRACADRDETWINPALFDLYGQLHQMGHAHSFEIWEGAQMIGGVFGITLGAAFFGESMFSGARDGSKIALKHLVDHLNAQGFQLFDTQFITDHLASLGAVEIPRARYRSQLEAAISVPDIPFDPRAR